MHRVIGLSVCLILLIVAFPGNALNENDPCTDPNGQAGTCIYLQECDSLATILRKGSHSQQERNFITQSRCGRTDDGKNLVCCRGIVGIVGLPKAPKDCGLDMTDRIVGGNKTRVDEFPWTALIQYRKPNGRFGFYCGASLINSRYVITAAHCIQAIPRNWNVVGVRLGEWDLNTENDCDEDMDTCSDPPVDMGVEQIIVHENYNPLSKEQYNDIALIRFTRDVRMSPYIFPICLPLKYSQRARNNVGTKGFAAGWGKTENATASNVKLKVQLEVKDLASCSIVYKAAGVLLKDTQLCAGGVKGADTCNGDSGGPYTRLDGSNHYLLGIVSFGPSKCGTADAPGVYTNVAKYMDWIKKNVKP